MRHNGERQPEEILADIEHTRTEMDATLDAIERRLTPGQLVDQGLHYLRDSGGREFFSNLGGAVKQNPIPVALVGVGIAWLMMGGNKPRDYGGSASAEGLTQRASEAASSARERIGGTASAAREKISGTAAAARERFDAARGRAQELGRTARQGMDRARGGYERMVREQPLALGAIGLAIGAVIAAAAPRTRQEDRLMGAASDRVADRARELAEEGLGTAEQVAAEAGKTVAEKARQQIAPESSPSPRGGDGAVATIMTGERVP